MMMRPLSVAAVAAHVCSVYYIDDGTFAATLYGSQTSSSRVNCIYDDLITDGNSLPVITTANFYRLEIRPELKSARRRRYTAPPYL